MQQYGNRQGHSGVLAYEIGHDSIAVKFANGHVYQYTYRSAGLASVEQMKVLARAGRGLSTFISQHVRNAYER